MRYPPYTENKLKWLMLLNDGIKVPKWVMVALTVIPADRKSVV